MTTRANANQDRSIKVQTVEDARACLHDKGALTDAGDPIDVDALKTALLMLTARKDTANKIKEGLKAIAIGLEEMRAGEVVENMAATVKTAKEMAEQVKELAERIEEGRVVEGRATQSGGEGREERVAKPTASGMNIAQAARGAEHEEVLQRVKSR
ncbi:hypothetical protein E4T56_gene5238 [Termitomyces sp. T112]|nr:hypothetical protein E4T56_gene5238 [Termitomyces sp. T112]